MKILYVSIHQALEYDELRMFRDAGHEVFSLGSQLTEPAFHGLRPPLDLGPFGATMKARFDELGGRYAFDAPPLDMVIPEAFVDLFDVCIVMHDVGILHRHWHALSRIPVVWRSIGVDLVGAEWAMQSYRARGCYVVRYSPAELAMPHAVGTDAVIRFPKKIADFKPWTGTEAAIFKVYADFRNRLPAEHDFVERLAAGRRFLLGGGRNEDSVGSVGILSYERLLEMLRSCRVYFYGAGPPAPYTLNFIEAWLAGIPVVALRPEAIYGAQDSRYAEIHRLIAHGRDGFLVSTLEEAAAICDRLLADRDYAARIGARGAAKAAQLFRDDVIARQWNRLLKRVAAADPRRPRQGIVGRLRARFLAAS